MGESRTGKTIACDAYRLRHKPIQEPGKPPIVPVAYILVPPDCGSKDLFGLIIAHLILQMTKGTVAEIRERTRRVLKGCGVEMFIIDEADRLKPNTFRDVRDIGENLGITVVLVGTDRLLVIYWAMILNEQWRFGKRRFCNCLLPQIFPVRPCSRRWAKQQGVISVY